MTSKTAIIPTSLPYINLKVKQIESPFGTVINHNPKAMETVILKTLLEFHPEPKEPIIIDMIALEKSFKKAS